MILRILCLCVLTIIAPADVLAESPTIQPLLQRCLECHAGTEPAGGLNLLSRELAMRGGDSGPVLNDREPLRGQLFRQIASKKMPPEKPFRDAEIALVRDWLLAGAKWPEGLQQPAAKDASNLWSVQPRQLPLPPTVRDSTSIRTPIDAFVQARLEAANLRPAPPADRLTLLRRLTLDLTGLPPTPAEIDAFVKDSSPAAYDRVVERLLASPHYGERWARHWLDLARFGESHGFERDNPRDHAWPYRDYVIRSFNADKPYGQFIREQLAGDVLQPITADGVIATGFLVAGPNDEAGKGSASQLLRARIREDELEDILSTVCQTFLGLTVNCARCHDHKFDPIPARDYYRIRSVFDGVHPGNRAIPNPKQEAERRQLQARIQAIDERLKVLIHDGTTRFLRSSGQLMLDTALPPRPLARWTFDGDARDQIGGLHGTLTGGARIENGRLIVDGKQAFVATRPLEKPLTEKTLEAWVMLPDRKQGGGACMSVETLDGAIFDAIVFGERQAGRWMAGSESFRRTRDVDGSEEFAGPKELIHLAIVYQTDGHITIYRNGKPYGRPYRPVGDHTGLQTYPAGKSRVLFGLRHTGGGRAFLNGAIEEARLYDRALSADEIAASARTLATSVRREDAVAALLPAERAEVEKLTVERRQLESRQRLIATDALVYAAVVRPAPPARVLARGDVEKPGAVVAAGGLSTIRNPSADFGLPPDAPEGERRLRFADWIAHPDHPLTARVMVNRIWQHHFGRGLAAASSDFGRNGEPPSHPELLDWLAGELVRSGGSIKHIHRLIVRSSVYQQSTQFNADAAGKDADNRLLWRQSPRRLEGETVRDAMLAASGQLNLQMGGPSYRPFRIRQFNAFFYDLFDRGEPAYQRRSIYRMNVLSARDPLLEGFDCPDPATRTPRRSSTTTPLQALALMNNSFVLRQASRLADRVKAEAGREPAEQVRLAFRLTLGRTPTDAEQAASEQLIRQHGLASLGWVLFNTSEFLYLR